MPIESVRKLVKQIARKSKSSFYYSFKFLNSRQRDAIYSVYSFCRITDDIVDSEEERAVKEEKLLQWENKIKEMVATNTSSHPVLRNLANAVSEFKIPVEYLYELVDGARMDLKNVVFNTWNELYNYCYKVASVVGFMSIHIFGFKNPQSLLYAEKLGIALQLTNIMRDVGKDIELKRIYLPREELKKFGVSESDLFDKNYSDSFRELMEFQYHRALSLYMEADKSLPPEDKQFMLPSIIMKETYYAILKKIKKINYDTLNYTPVLSGFEKKRIAVVTWFKYSVGAL